MKEFRTFSEAETVEAGFKLGSVLKAGDVVCINGDLGTGKTAFTKGIAQALGIDGYITSPTFTIVNEHKGTVDLFHFDVYRIASPDEMFEIGFDEYLDGKGVVVIEWSDLIAEIIPPEHIRVDMEKLPDDFNARVIRINFIGKGYEHYEGRL